MVLTNSQKNLIRLIKAQRLIVSVNTDESAKDCRITTLVRTIAIVIRLYAYKTGYIEDLPKYRCGRKVNNGAYWLDMALNGRKSDIMLLGLGYD